VEFGGAGRAGSRRRRAFRASHAHLKRSLDVLILRPNMV